jgi:ADP-ribosylglycohydrolase
MDCLAASLGRTRRILRRCSVLGAIAGDIIGSVYESNRAWERVKSPDFEPLFAERARFTDDTVLTVAVADVILGGGDLVDLFKEYARAYPAAGYGSSFRIWAQSDSREAYQSWGNGSAMRVSPVGHAYTMLDEVLLRARWSAQVTHDHPEGIQGAQAIAAAIFLARTGSDKGEIADFVERRFHYDLSRSIAEIRPGHCFDSSCRGTVPPALIAFLEATDYESAVRLAVSLGGDCDTLACIAGAVAEAYYGGVPGAIREQALARLDDRLRGVIAEFESRFSRTP